MSKRIFYFDALRALAILSVLAVHIFDGHTFYIVAADYGTMPSFNWFLAVFVNNGLRIGVDLFLNINFLEGKRTRLLSEFSLRVSMECFSHTTKNHYLL